MIKERNKPWIGLLGALVLGCLVLQQINVPLHLALHEHTYSGILQPGLSSHGLGNDGLGNDGRSNHGHGDFLGRPQNLSAQNCVSEQGSLSVRGHEHDQHGHGHVHPHSHSHPEQDRGLDPPRPPLDHDHSSEDHEPHPAEDHLAQLSELSPSARKSIDPLPITLAPALGMPKDEAPLDSALLLTEIDVRSPSAIRGPLAPRAPPHIV